MKVHELIVFLQELADQGCDNAHVTIYDTGLKMPAVVQGAVYNEFAVELSTEKQD